MKRTELVVRGILVDGRYVLLAQNKKKGHLFLPGGHIEFAEAASHALVREIREELSCTACIDRFLGAVEHTWKDTRGLHAEINLIFSISCPAVHPGKEPVSYEKGISFCWHPIDDLASVDFQPAILRTILPEWIEATSQARWASSFKH